MEQGPTLMTMMATFTFAIALVYMKKSDGYSFTYLCFLQLVLQLLVNTFLFPTVAATVEIYGGEERKGRSLAEDNMRVKLSSLQPSQLLPHFKTGQQRLQGPGLQQRAIQRSTSIDSDDLGSSSNPITVPDADAESSPDENGNKPFSSDANKKTSAENPQKLQLSQDSNDIFKRSVPSNSGVQGQGTGVSDAVFKVPFPPGFNKIPSNDPVYNNRGVPFTQENFQQPISPTDKSMVSGHNEVNSPVHDTSSSFNSPIPMSPVSGSPEISPVPSPRGTSPEISPVLNEAPRPNSPLYPPEIFQKSGPNSPERPDIPIIQDNRPLPSFNSIIKDRPTGANYAAVTRSDGSKGYRIDSPVWDARLNYGASGIRNPVPSQNLPYRPKIPIFSGPVEGQPVQGSRIPPQSSQSNPIPNINEQNSLPGNPGTQIQLPSVHTNTVLQLTGVRNEPVPNNNGQSQSIQELRLINNRLESDRSFFKNVQFQREPQQHPMPFPSINSGAATAQPRSLRPSPVPTGNYQPDAGQIRPYAPSTQAQPIQNTMGLRSYLSSPPLSALKSRQRQLPVRISPATDNINTYPNGLTEKQIIFPPQPAPASPDLRFNNQNQLPPPDQISQQRLGSTLQIILPQDPFAQKINSEASRTTAYLQQSAPSPPVTASQYSQSDKRHAPHTPLQGTLPYRYPEPYQSLQGQQPERIPTPFTSSRGAQPERIPTPFTPPRGAQPERIPAPFPPSRGAQPERIPAPFPPSRGAQPERIPTPFTSSSGLQPERSLTPFPQSKGPLPNGIREPYTSVPGSLSNRNPETLSLLLGPPQNRIPPTPFSPLQGQGLQPNRVADGNALGQNSQYSRFSPYQSAQANSPILRGELRQNNQYPPTKRGRFIGQTSQSQQNEHQQLYRQPEYAQEYFRRLQQGQLPGNEQNPKAYQRNFAPQGRGRTKQKEKSQIQAQQMDIQRRFQEAQEAEYRNLGQFQQIPPRGNLAGGQYQQLQTSTPQRQIPLPPGFYNPYINQVPPGLQQIPNPSQPNSPFTPEPFIYRGQHFSYGQNPQNALVQEKRPCSNSQTPQYPSQEGFGLRPYANDGQNGQSQASSSQRISPTTTHNSQAYNKPAIESLTPTSTIYVSNNTRPAIDNSFQPPLRPVSRLSSANSDDQRGPDANPNQLHSKATGNFNASSPTTKFHSQPILQNEYGNSSYNPIPILPNLVNIDAKPRTDAGVNEISTRSPAYFETIKESQDTSSESTPQTTPSILPYHRGEMPLYSQPEIDSHHRRMLENNQTKEDIEFESGPRLLQYFLQGAKQVLRRPNDNNTETKVNLATEKGNDARLANGNPDGNANVISHAAERPINTKLSTLPRTASTNSNSTNGAGEFGQYTGGPPSTTAVSSTDNSRWFSKPPHALPTNLLQQTTEIGKEQSENRDTDTIRKQRSASIDNLYDFLMESGVVNY